MDSSKVAAFCKFETWKKSHTVLQLAVSTTGTEVHFKVSLIHPDFDNNELSFVDEVTHEFKTLDLRGSSFTVAQESVTVIDERFGKFVFEEVLVV